MASIIQNLIRSGRSGLPTIGNLAGRRFPIQKRYFETVQPKQSNGKKTGITSVVAGSHQSAKVIFDDSRVAEFKYVWLRDNCKCSECFHGATKQKLIDSPSIDVNIQPRSLEITGDGKLAVNWPEGNGTHQTVHDAEWLLKYGNCFMENHFKSPADDHVVRRPPLTLWDRTTIWNHLPEMSYTEFMESPNGLVSWLEMFYKYGIAILRGVPVTQGKVVEVVQKFAYVKETSYGVTFDVVAEPDPEHLAYTGTYLHHHTDMNYREKSPGMQLLHCLKSTQLHGSERDVGGLSFFVDGFRAAKWLRDNESAAFHILAATPVKFQIEVNDRKFSNQTPILCTNNEGHVTEIHYNNRTMGPLQMPSHLVTPFYHAYRLLTDRLRAESMQFSFQLKPGDLVAFNNHRILHGRTAYDQTRVIRHLEGCYVEIDETMATLGSLLVE